MAKINVFCTSVYSPKINLMDIQDFYDGMAKVACSVTVVTTNGPAGKAGITVSSMSSVSADPPILLICIHKDSPICNMIRDNGRFCVNVLKSDQTELSELFAGRLETDNTSLFNKAEWSFSENEAPVLMDALVSFDCLVSKTVLAGSHHVFFGNISDIRISYGEALIYANRTYQI